jgi:hypothetical protein
MWSGKSQLTFRRNILLNAFQSLLSRQRRVYSNIHDALKVICIVNFIW